MFDRRFKPFGAIGATLLLAGCLSTQTPYPPPPGVAPRTPGESPNPTPTPSRSPSNKPMMFADAGPEAWSRATISGTVTDSQGKPLDSATVTAVLTDSMGWQAVVFPPDTETEGDQYIVHKHVLAIGTLNQFASNSDTASTTTASDGKWSLDGAPVGGVIQLTVAKSGYQSVTTARIVKQAAAATWAAPIDPAVNVFNLSLTKTP